MMILTGLTPAIPTSKSLYSWKFACPDCNGYCHTCDKPFRVFEVVIISALCFYLTVLVGILLTPAFDTFLYFRWICLITISLLLKYRVSISRMIGMMPILVFLEIIFSPSFTTFTITSSTSTLKPIYISGILAKLTRIFDLATTSTFFIHADLTNKMPAVAWDQHDTTGSRYSSTHRLLIPSVFDRSIISCR